MIIGIFLSCIGGVALGIHQHINKVPFNLVNVFIFSVGMLGIAMGSFYIGLKP